MKKLYHISRHYIGDKQVFIPRIPTSQNKSEIEMPARICASETLTGCWSAISCCNDLTMEMKANNTNGYYYFVYSFDAKSFKKSPVFDAEKTGELISEKFVTGTFEFAFYVKKDMISNPSFSVSEKATKEEAVSAYYDWQKEDLLKIEKMLEDAEW